LKIEKLEARLKKFLRLQEDFTDLDLSEVHPEDLAGDEDDEVRDALEVGKKLRYKVAHLNVAKWMQALNEDKQQLNLLYVQAKDVTPDRDLKLQRLREIISAKVRNPPINRDGKPNRQILIFTAFADTARYLYEHLHGWAKDELGIDSAHSGLPVPASVQRPWGQEYTNPAPGARGNPR
jgi:hypothetical protein